MITHCLKINKLYQSFQLVFILRMILRINSRILIDSATLQISEEIYDSTYENYELKGTGISSKQICKDDNARFMHNGTIESFV